MDDALTVVSSVDGRYREQSKALSPYLSEYALIRYRVLVECEYLLMLSETQGLGCSLSDEEKKKLQTLPKEFSLADALRVKAFEATTNHDVKAVEYYLRDEFPNQAPWIHFALTSEDINSIAYTLGLRDALEQVFFALLYDIEKALDALSEEYAGTPMLARTHGQSATPTTFGKEMKIFVSRMRRQTEGLAKQALLVKFSGATGNWNAQHLAFPAIDWIGFSLQFVERFNTTNNIKLELNVLTPQIEPHDTYAETFDTLKRLNTVLIDFSQDMWRYISDGWVGQKKKEGEVGSSTMPHKVNPIDFENAEGNLGVANTLFEHYACKLPISRLQRDLTDSTVVRSFGTALSHALVAYQSLMKGLGKISVHSEVMRDALASHPEVLAEAIQTILRREGEKDAYEKLKELTRGQTPTLLTIRAFVEGLSISESAKQELLALTPETYLGLAKRLASGTYG